MHNAPGKVQKYVGVAFAPFAKRMTIYFCRSLPFYYVLPGVVDIAKAIVI